MAGVDLGYDTDGLRQGGREALGAGQVASGAAGILRGATCPASALGVVAGAEALAAALARSRDAHVALAEQVHADHVDLDARAGRRGGCRGRADGLVGGGRPDGGTAMTAPAGVVDLSLPDYATLVARAGMNPDAEAARVASAAPADVRGAGTAFGRAGGELDSAFTASMGAQGSIGAAFTNGGAPVLDRGTHVANLPPGFGDAGTRLAGTSGRLTAVAEDLAATMRETSTAVTGLHGELQQTRSSWAARVAAAGTLPDGSGGGLIPQEAIPGLLAERDRIAAGMATRVGAVGREVVGRIGTYETVINDAVRLLADHGFVPPAERDAGPPPAPVVEYGGGADPTGYGAPLMAGYAADPVNTALGNFVEVETDVAFGGLLAGLTFARTYNSRSDRVGAFGPGWSSWASTRLVEGTWTAEFEGPDGQRVAFPRTGTGFGRAVGIDALVERAGSGLVLAWFDGRRWEFDAAGRVERTWAGPGTAVRFGHDDDGRLVELVHERGRRLGLEWDGDRIVAVSGSDGRRVAYRYDQGLLAEADGPAGARRYGSDGAGRVASVTDADGVVELVNTYDEQGRVLTQRSPFGRLVTFSYGSDGTTVVADDSAGPTNVYRHDRAGRLVAVTDGHGHTLRKRYDAWGNPVEIVERGGGVTRQEFDDRGHLVRRTTPSGAVFTVSWDDADRVVTVTAAGAETRFTYVGAERIPSEIVDPEGGVTRLQVSGGLVQAVTDPDGVTVRLRHDGDGHLVEAVDAAGGVARIDRDPAGLPVAVVTPAGRRTEVVHDGHGRPVRAARPGRCGVAARVHGRRPARGHDRPHRGPHRDPLRPARRGRGAGRRARRGHDTGLRRVRQPRRPHRGRTGRSGCSGTTRCRG